MVKIIGLAVLVTVSCTSCATTEEPAENIEWSSRWFQCESRFDCVAVYDAYCKYHGVNAQFLAIYQDWARQQVARSGERVVCEPVGDDKPAAAYCRNKKCVYP